MLPRFATFTYIMEFPHSLGEQSALNVAFIWGFQGVLKPLVLKEQFSRKKFLIGLPYINRFPGQILGCRRSTGSSFSDTLGTSSLVEDRSRDQKCMVSLFLFRSN